MQSATQTSRLKDRYSLVNNSLREFKHKLSFEVTKTGLTKPKENHLNPSPNTIPPFKIT
jgi:hypothetical protein